MKYPRTYHLPWSPGTTKDDKKVETIDHMYGTNVVITEKLDGECTSMYCDRIHARSEDSKHHDSRGWVKGFWGEIQHRIPEGIQIVGENLYARHSIYYHRLETYFYGFAAIKDEKHVMDWRETLNLFDSVGIEPVPVLCFGPLSQVFTQRRLMKPEFTPTLGDEMEGYVIRSLREFPVADFDKHVYKYVREDHVKTDTHWTKKWSKNDLKDN